MSRLTGLDLIDKSIVSLSGSSQTLVAANESRQVLIIMNTSAADNIGVNLAGGTAAIGGTGTITLEPYGSIVLDTFVPTGQINVIGTSGQPVVCYVA